MTKNIFIDIDGTLTWTPDRAWGPIRPLAIQRVKDLIAAGHRVILWSARGAAYAREFAEAQRLKPYATLPKPDFYVDDVEGIRERMAHITPGEFESAGIG